MKYERPPIKENHSRCGWEDRSFICVDHYNKVGLNPGYFWEKVLFKPTPSNEDMELVREEACRVFVQHGGQVVITILDSLAIPENDRNSPKTITDRELAKKKTGDPGDQYYDWTPMDDLDQRLSKARYMIDREKKAERNNGHKGNGRK